MMTKDEILTLKTKLLPAGADAVIDFLAARHAQLDGTNIVLENVPLLILGRHGMIARIPINGRIKKVSQPDDVLQILQAFFSYQTTTDKLYLFVNLPDLPIPKEVKQVLSEMEERANRKEQVKKRIDKALDERDRVAFDAAVKELERIVRDEERQYKRSKRLM